MINIENKSYPLRHDFVNFCKNCGEISSPVFLLCPSCGHQVVRKKVIYSLVDYQEKKYFPLVVSKSELKNRFINPAIVDSMKDDSLSIISRYIGNECIDSIPDLYLKVFNKIKYKLPKN